MLLFIPGSRFEVNIILIKQQKVISFLVKMPIFNLLNNLDWGLDTAWCERDLHIMNAKSSSTATEIRYSIFYTAKSIRTHYIIYSDWINFCPWCLMPRSSFKFYLLCIPKYCLFWWLHLLAHTRLILFRRSDKKTRISSSKHFFSSLLWFTIT